MPRTRKKPDPTRSAPGWWSLVVLLALPDQAVLAAEVGPAVHQKLSDSGHARVVVSLRPPSSDQGGRQRKIGALQVEVLSRTGVPVGQAKTFRSLSGFSARLDPGQIDRLAEDPDVLRIDLDAGGRGGLGISVPQVNGDVLASRGITGQGVVVAVLDSGIDSDHPDFAGKVIEEACFLDFDGMIDGMGRCPNGSDRQFGAGAAEDDQGHGTQVAGVIAAAGAEAGPGMAPDVQLVSIKVTDNSDPAGRFEFSSEILAAIDHVVTDLPQVRVLNISLGTSLLFSEVCDDDFSVNQLIAEAAATLSERGAVVVAISHNDESSTEIASPACISNVIAVGAVNPLDGVTPFSNSNAQVDLLAPGAGILTTALGGGNTRGTGTSFAAPHVSGCVALMAQLGLADSVEGVRQRLISSDVVVTDTRNGLSFPRLDCAKAVEYAISGATSGLWFEPETAGQGFLIEVLPDGRIVAFWFTFDPDGHPLWLIGEGTFMGGAADFQVSFVPDGPAFGPGFDPALVELVPWGTWRMEFESCTQAILTWQSALNGFGDGEQRLERLSSIQGLHCVDSL